MEPYAYQLRDLLPWALGLVVVCCLLWATSALWLHRPRRTRKPKVEDVMRTGVIVSKRERPPLVIDDSLRTWPDVERDQQVLLALTLYGDETLEGLAQSWSEGWNEAWAVTLTHHPALGEAPDEVVKIPWPAFIAFINGHRGRV